MIISDNWWLLGHFLMSYVFFCSGDKKPDVMVMENVHDVDDPIGWYYPIYWDYHNSSWTVWPASLKWCIVISWGYDVSSIMQ